jgi:hypothetical protein
MNTKETNMKSKMIVAVLAAVCVFSVGSLSAKDIEFSLLENAAQPSLFSPEAMTLAASMVASPAPAPAAALPVNIVRPRGFDGFRGQRLEKGLFTASLVAMAALNLADYLSTRQALKQNNGLVEGNPLMKPFVKNAAVFAAVKAGTTVLSVWGMKSLFKRDKTTAWVMTTLSNFLLSYVVSNNMRLISRTRPR